MLEAERALTRVRSEVESMDARKRNMDLLSGMTTLVVKLSEPHRAVPAARRVWEPVPFIIGAIPRVGILAAVVHFRRRRERG